MHWALSHICLFRHWGAVAHEWRVELKPSAGSAVRKKYERLLLAFERAVSEGAPSRPLPNQQAAKAAERKVRCLFGQGDAVLGLACASYRWMCMQTVCRRLENARWRVPYPHCLGLMQCVCVSHEEGQPLHRRGQLCCQIILSPFTKEY